jgi:hypothetical protein
VPIWRDRDGKSRVANPDDELALHASKEQFCILSYSQISRIRERHCNMPENAPDKTRGWFKTMVWKPYPDIEKSAEKYRTTPLLKSDRAIFVYFFVVMMVISSTMAGRSI